jgi:hypothetical protein
MKVTAVSMKISEKWHQQPMAKKAEEGGVGEGAKAARKKEESALMENNNNAAYHYP